MNFKTIIARLKNPGTILALAGVTILILTTNGVVVNEERVITTIKGLCTIGVILGVLNDPETEGLDLPFLFKGKK